jgi:phage repressor protein C with HTH and peptisase S24 domain
MQQKSNKNSSAKERILLYLDYKGISKYECYNKTGMSRSVLSQPNGMTEDNILKFLAVYKDISLDWLLTGIGSMLKQPSGTVPVPPNQPFPYEDIEDDTPSIAASPEAKYVKLSKISEPESRPRIPYNAAAGTLAVAFDGISANICEQLPVIRQFPKYDFTILAFGDSMSPEYHSGDELACLLIKNSFVQWGRVYILDTSQGIVVKRIFDANDNILCKSDNPNYNDFFVSKSDIYNLALVVGIIRRY